MRIVFANEHEKNLLLEDILAGLAAGKYCPVILDNMETLLTSPCTIECAECWGKFLEIETEKR